MSGNGPRKSISIPRSPCTPSCGPSSKATWATRSARPFLSSTDCCWAHETCEYSAWAPTLVGRSRQLIRASEQVGGELGSAEA
jgi:hypothetical protein